MRRNVHELWRASFDAFVGVGIVAGPTLIFSVGIFAWIMVVK